MKKFISVSYKCWNALSTVACVFLILNMLVIIANIIMRRFAGSPIYGSTELVSYASLVTASIALAQNEWFEGNIRMTLVLESIGKQASRVIQFIVYIVCSVAFVYITYLLTAQAAAAYVKGDISTDLHMPIFIFKAILAIGFIFVTICIICKTIVLGYVAKTGEDINLRLETGYKEDAGENQ